ncbi:MAG: IS3 family transposase [Steroidobacteraceae bacterium]
MHETTGRLGVKSVAALSEIRRYPLTTREAMISHVFEYLEIYYNRVRRHSANNWLSPVDFERLYHQNSEERAVH